MILDLLNDIGKHVYHIVIASGDEKWFLELDYVNMGKPITIYFEINDAKVFKEKVGQSLKEQKGEGFNLKNTILNPSERSIDHILMGFPQNKQKGSWYIMLGNGLSFVNQSCCDWGWHVHIQGLEPDPKIRSG